MVRVVTENEYDLIKSQLQWVSPQGVTALSGRSLAVVMRVDAARDYQQYKDLVRAEHPPVKNSLGDRVIALEEDMKHVKAYVEHEQRNKTEIVAELHGEEL